MPPWLADMRRSLSGHWVIEQEKHAFKGPGRIVYRVPDVEKAKEWRRKVPGAGPVFDSPIGVVFLVGASFLVLGPGGVDSK